MKKTKLPLILASNSPRRKELLERLGIPFSVFTREVEEVAPYGTEVDKLAGLLALKKAKAYEDLSQNNIILTADTLVLLDGSVLGKPNSEVEAKEMLRSLSGREHFVDTGVCIYTEGHQNTFSERTTVVFKELKKEEIAYYVHTFKPMDKAGAYGIQDWIGMIGVKGIKGDYYNVMGLPVNKLYDELSPFLI